MTNAEVQELVTKIDDVREAINRLEARLDHFENHQLGKLRTQYRHIVRVEGVMGGRPIIDGTRLSVKLTVGWAKLGLDTEEIVAKYPELNAAQVADALAYYRDHPEEIEAEFSEEARILSTEIPRLQAMRSQIGSKN